MRNIAIIPARSGSKGLKNKNIKLLNGKPLIAYTIEAALKSKCFDVVFVSTDSKKYAEISKKYGAEVPFLRSKKTSSDKATSWSVVDEVINNYKKMGKSFDTFMLLQPTSPFRDEKDIKKAYKMLIDKNVNSIVSVCKTDCPPEMSYEIDNDLELSSKIINKITVKRRQKYKDYYRLNGAIYLCNTKVYKKNKTIYKNKCYVMIMNKIKSIDIDDIFDFQIANSLFYKNYN